MEDVIYKVLNLESPFRWRPAILSENRHEFDEEHEEAYDFSFFNFCTKLVAIYDNFMNSSRDEAVRILDDVEKKLISLGDNDNALYAKFKDALFHVLYACKTHMAINSEKNDAEISLWLNKTKALKELNDANKAAILVMNAVTHALYSQEHIENSISQINLAISKDPQTLLWPFLKGWCLQKQRFAGEVPGLWEKEMFELAYEGDKENPLFMVYLADTYREISQNCKKQNYLWFIAKSVQVNPEAEVNKKFETALDLYKKSYAQKPNCPVIAFKCVNGLMRLPSKYQDVKLIKQIISNCEGKFPTSGFGNLVLALYHERINKKISLAQRHLARCVELNVFSGCMNSVRLEFVEQKENSNSVQSLEKFLKIFHEPVKQEMIISQIISYYIFIDGNLKKSCEYVLEYYRKGNRGNSLEKHSSIFKMTNGPISLVDVITDQVKIKLKDRSISKETRAFFNDFVKQMSFHNVVVLKGNPKNLLEQILKSSAVPKKHPNSSSRPKHPEGTDRRVNSEYPNQRDNSRFSATTERTDRRKCSDFPKQRDNSRFSATTERTDRRMASEYPNQRSKIVSKFDKNVEPSGNAARQNRAPEERSTVEDDIKLMRNICREDDLRTNVRSISENFGKLAIGKPEDYKSQNGAQRVKNVKRLEEYDESDESVHRRESRGVRKDRVSAKGRRHSSVERSDDESRSRRKHKHHRRRGSSASSADSDYSRERRRRRRKQQKKYRDSDSAEEEAYKRRRSPSPSKRDRKRSPDGERSRRHRRKHRASDYSSSGTERSEANRKRGKHSRSKNTDFSRERDSYRADERRSRHDHKHSSSRKSKKEPKTRYPDSGED